jgi:hypothetical protein
MEKRRRDDPDQLARRSRARPDGDQRRRDDGVDLHDHEARADFLSCLWITAPVTKFRRAAG